MTRLRRSISALFFLFVIGWLSGCALVGQSVRHVERLDPNWSQNQQWTIRQTIWPARLADPEARGDTSVSNTYRLRVESIGAGENQIRFEAWDGIDRYWLIFQGYTLESVQHRLGNRQGATQINTVQVNRFDGGPMIFLDDPDANDGLWVFPTLSGHQFQQRSRFPVLSSNRSTGDWYEQKAVPVEGGIRFVIEDEDGTERFVMIWEPGKPWWSEMVWTRNERIVGHAELVEETDKLNFTRE